MFGSSGLIATLAGEDLIDRCRLLVVALIPGAGKRISATPAELVLLGSEVSPGGVVILRYGRPRRP